MLHPVAHLLATSGPTQKNKNVLFGCVTKCIDLGFDEINVIQTIFLVIKCILKFARLMGHPVMQ